MTYADTGVRDVVAFIRWFKDSNTRITTAMMTDGASTGLVEFQQYLAPNYDVISSSGTAYSPGINVPYNIASRHGSAFINGAVDGTSLTADTTPVALPDLSATNLRLAFIYMGCLKLFRMWDQDLGDTGIAAASAPSLEPSLSLLFDGSGNSFTVEDWSE
jgi:hypothetical protein